MDKKGKRINFIAVQAQQGIAADGYQLSPLRTGYEQIVASRPTAMFASMAEDDGEIIDVTARVIKVKLKGGEVQTYPLGRLYGSAGGTTYPHTLLTTWKKGDKVKYGDTLTYNKGFFEPDVYNPGQVVYKHGLLCRTAFIDVIGTLEDGSLISEEIAKQLTTQTTDTRTVEVRFDQHVHDLLEVGKHVDLDSILCTIEDPEVADNPFFDAAASDTLARVTASTPRAKTTGVISKIEVFYHGDYEDLSDNLKVLADASDKERRLQAKALGEPVFTGQVDTSFRIRGNALDPDTVAFQFSIDHDVPMGVGDKGVFSNQMKTVVSHVMEGVNETLDGQPLGGIFSEISVAARIVESAKLWGATNTLLRVAGPHVAAVYRGTKDGIKPNS